MGSYGFPPIQSFFDMLYGAEGVDTGGLTLLYFGGASGLVFTGNPPFTITDFLGVYPKFFGAPTNYTGLSLTADSTTVGGFTPTTIVGLSVGQLVVNLNSLTSDTIITAVDINLLTVTLSWPAAQNDSVLTVYQAPFVPLVVVLSYVNLALASVMYQRFFEAWFMAVCYYIAHFLTMYMRSESGQQSFTAIQAASSGLTKGIAISRAAGDVSASFKVLEGFDEWGAWRETQYGELFITLARSVACGPIYVP
jgi:hypothetical protein